MSALELFTYESVDVRVVTQDGDPWFVAADVCAVLGIGNPSQAVSYLDDDERMIVNAALISSEGRPQDTIGLISEAGLYSLILRSRKPEAKVFKRWVTHEVLPAIRRTGSYAVSQVPAQRAIPQTFADALQLAADQAREIDRQSAEIAELEPKAAIADTFLDATGDYSVREAAQILARDHGIDLGERRLFDRLHQIGWLDPTGRPYQKHIDCGRLRSKPQTYGHPRTGERIVAKPQVRVTPKGVADLYRLLAPGAGLALLAGPTED